MVAARIQETGRIAQTAAVVVWDKDNRSAIAELARYGDIVILLRSVSGWAESFTESPGAAREFRPYAESQSRLL